MDTYWITGANNLGRDGRWAFAEFRDVYAMEEDFTPKVEAEIGRVLDSIDF